MLRGAPLDIAIDDETLALPVIDAVGPGGSFLPQKHTRRHARDYLRPTLFNRRPYSVWADEGGDLLAGAAARVQKLLEEYRTPELDKTVRRQLDRYCLEGGAGR
jgi:trimethylamine---corrinoid protein Co-methyltransferase